MTWPFINSITNSIDNKPYNMQIIQKITCKSDSYL